MQRRKSIADMTDSEYAAFEAEEERRGAAMDAHRARLTLGVPVIVRGANKPDRFEGQRGSIVGAEGSVFRVRAPDFGLDLLVEPRNLALEEFMIEQQIKGSR